ncbi:MAG: DNA gyrase inhibitor YacG [Hyphomicrobiaceae bacterium]
MGLRSCFGDLDDVVEAGICPECGDTTVHRYRPFCSKRCADVDLSRWLSGAYAIAGGNADEDEDGDEANALDMARQASAAQQRDDDSGGDKGFH